VWHIFYRLDDFGRLTERHIAYCKGKQSLPQGDPTIDSPDEKYSGEIAEMPPDRFRRETSQPIPQKVPVNKEVLPQTELSRATRRTNTRKEI
ncbi:MAG: hypothetical protein ACP5EP_11470, partial [Acidobacteriaceae bacterium]